MNTNFAERLRSEIIFLTTCCLGLPDLSLGRMG